MLALNVPRMIVEVELLFARQLHAEVEAARAIEDGATVVVAPLRFSLQRGQNRIT
jgi:hypothetical protein